MNWTSIVICGALFLITLVSGVGVTRSGRPHNALLFNLHKLIALATVVVFVVNVIPMYKAMEMQHTLEWVSGILTGLLFIALFASGAVLSFEKPAPVIVLRIHQVVPLLSLVFSGLTIYLLSSG